MARIQLHFQGDEVYNTQLQIRVSELNYGNHLGNDSLLGLMQEARVQYFNSLGQTEKDFYGVGIIMSDVAVVYKSEGFGGNEIQFDIALSDFSPKGFDMYYNIYNNTTQKQLAIAKTGIVCFDYSIRKAVNLPEIFLSQLGLSHRY
ncbi:MAG: thioesterase family protein [Bacteroidota bacterium]|nr:thioesterase family protein [Bacteroidota bacterium]